MHSANFASSGGTIGTCFIGKVNVRNSQVVVGNAFGGAHHSLADSKSSTLPKGASAVTSQTNTTASAAGGSHMSKV